MLRRLLRAQLGLLDRWGRRADVHALGEALQGLGMAGVVRPPRALMTSSKPRRCAGLQCETPGSETTMALHSVNFDAGLVSAGDREACE